MCIRDSTRYKLWNMTDWSYQSDIDSYDIDIIIENKNCNVCINDNKLRSLYKFIIREYVTDYVTLSHIMFLPPTPQAFNFFPLFCERS